MSYYIITTTPEYWPAQVVVRADDGVAVGLIGQTAGAFDTLAEAEEALGDALNLLFHDGSDAARPEVWEIRECVAPVVDRPLPDYATLRDAIPGM